MVNVGVCVRIKRIQSMTIALRPHEVIPRDGLISKYSIYVYQLYNSHGRWFTELGMVCERDVQCIQLAQCTHNVSDTHSDMMVCQCREEYANDDGTCSGEWDVCKQIT